MMPSLPKTKIKIALSVVLGVALILAACSFAFLKQNQKALQKTTVANQMMLAIFEKRLLADEYAYMHSERSKSQWFSRHTALERMVAENAYLFSDDKERELIDKIKVGLEESSNIFENLTALYQNESSSQPALYIKDQITHSASQLSVKAQEAVSAAEILRSINAQSAQEAFERIVLLFFSAGGIFLALLIASFWIIWRSTTVLFKEKAESEAMLQGIGDGVVAIDMSWKIVLWNKAATDISGWPREKALGKPFREVVKFIRERDREENVGFIEEVLLHGKVRHMENGTVLLKSDGTEIPVGDSAAPLFNEEGVLSGCIIIFRDVSLEHEAHKLKSDFAYASHQMRTPVNSALWSIESSLKETDPEKLKEKIRTSYDALLSVKKLTAELVEVSEIDQKTVVLNKNEVQFEQVVSEAIESCKELAMARGISVIVPLQLSVRILTDQKLLQRILTELIINAIEYAGSKSDVYIKLSEAPDSILVEIKNRGKGISEEDQPLIFTKFFRGSTIDTTIAGSGLGLYMAQGYAKLLNSKIWFKSVPNQETSFFLSIPKL